VAELADAGDSKRRTGDHQNLLGVAKGVQKSKPANQFTPVTLEKPCEPDRGESKGLAHQFAHQSEGYSTGFSNDFLDRALSVFQPLTQRELTREDARRILEGLRGLLA